MSRNPPVECEVEDVEEEGKPAVMATCTKCDHTTVSFGREERSIKRCLALMRDECPLREDNFYIQEE